MSKKITSIFICSNCDAQSPKWSGRCLSCGSWDTVKESTSNSLEALDEKKYLPAKIVNLSEVGSQNLSRIKTEILEIDRVLGGGIVPGSLTLLSGEPGIGKSTILAQMVDAVGKSIAKAGKDEKVIYISGEESAHQVKSRMERLKCTVENIDFISETSVERILTSLKGIKPLFLVVDSIQTVYSENLPSEPGGVSQIRSSTLKFLEYAKINNVPVVLVGHVTKDGSVAGPKALEHMVDTVIYLEMETNHNIRILRATKNRFGSINEIGLFEMMSDGFVELNNPSSVFVGNGGSKLPGAVLSCVMEGTRPFLVEIQALVTKTVFGYPQRKSSGFDMNRLQVLCAVLSKRTEINLFDQDVILNIVGGLKINDPALDVAVCMAIASSYLNKQVDSNCIGLGEVGLSGEVRNVARFKERMAEVEKMGFDKIVMPNIEAESDNIELRKFASIKDIISSL